MAPQPDPLDERFAGTFRKLFDTLERGGDQCSIERLQTLLEEKSKNLTLGLESFSKPSSQSRSKVTAGTSVSIDGKTINLTQAEKDFVLKLSDFFQLNELLCVSLWVAFKADQQWKLSDDKDYKLSEDESLLMRVMTFYYEDRLALLQCIASLLRIHLDPDHVYHSIAQDVVRRILKNEFFGRILEQLKSLTRQQVPPQYYSPVTLATVWAKQNLREQKSLLEVLFLAHVYSPCPAKRALDLIQEFEATSFGQHQEFGYVLDVEGGKLRDQVTHLCIVLSVQALNLSGIQDTLASRPTGERLQDSPDIIVKISQIALFLGDRPEHSVFLLGWSYFLSVMDDLLASVSSLTAYNDVRKFIDGELEISESHLLTDRPSARGMNVISQPSISYTEQVYRALAGRALKLNVFGYMNEILESQICREDDPNDSGYRFVLKGLLSAFLSTIQPYFLPVDSYIGLVDCVCTLFDNQPALCLEFWKKDFENEDLSTLLNTARGRFPVSFVDFTRLLASLSGSKSEDRLVEEPAACVFEYVKLLPSLTVMVKDTINLQLREEEDGTIVYANEPIRVIEDSGIVSGFVIPSGIIGLLVSKPDEKRVVKWRTEYSGWRLLVGVLARFVDRSKQSNTTDVEDLDGELSGNGQEAVNSILELIQKLMHARPTLVRALVEHVDETCRRIPREESEPPLLVALICEVLTYCSTIEQCPVETITHTLRCLTSLLPYYREEIWAYLKTAPILPRPNPGHPIASRFPPSSSVLTDPARQIHHIVSEVECRTGKYSLLLAFLNLVTALVRDVQRHWWIDGQPGSFGMLKNDREYQIETLYLCLHYLMLDVFPTYATWRYKHLSERFLIGSKVLAIFIEIAQYFKEGSGTGARKQGLSLGKLREDLLKNFLYDGGIYHVAPLLDAATEGAGIASSLYRNNRPKEALYAERSTQLTLVFIKLLLQHQLEAINTGKASCESALERLMLERAADEMRPDFLLRLTKHIYYQHNIMLPILATNIVTLLCRTLSAWKTAPNFVRHLGDKEQAQDIIRTYLSIAQDHFQDERLLSAIWQMITLLMETQPSLAILFLECGEQIMPSPKSAVKLLQEQKKQQAAADSAIRAAVDLLGHWEKLSIEKPTVLSNVLRFLATFWQTAFDHYALVQRARSDSALWDALGKILLNPNQIKPPENANLTFEKMDAFGGEDVGGLPPLMVSSGNEGVRRACCLYLSKAFVMRIMAFEIHLTAVSQQNLSSGGSINERLPAGLKSQLAKISDPSKLSAMRTSFVRNTYDPSLGERVRKDAETLLNMVGSSDVSRLLFTVGPLGFGDNDAATEPRQYGDYYIYDLRVAEARIQSLVEDISVKYHVEDQENTIVTPEVVAIRKLKKASSAFLTDLCLANHNWSIVDAQMILLRSFKSFIETCTGHANDLIWPNKTQGLRSVGLHDFLVGLAQDAQGGNREDGVTLTTYKTIVELVRGLTEDWIDANKSILLGTDQGLKRQYAVKTLNLLELYCGFLKRENFAVMSSVSGHVPVAFHRPLLEALLLSLRTLRRIDDATSGFQYRESAKLKACLTSLLEVTCESFQMLVYKAAAINASSVDDSVAEECIKDITVVIALLVELIHPSYQPDATKWLPIFQQFETVPTLMKLIYGGIELVVSEVDRQANASNSLEISPYAEHGFYLLLVLSAIPEAASVLVSNGLIDIFCNNALTSQLQRGTLDQFIRFGERSGTNNRIGYVERNPLHTIWCHMLCVVSNLLRSLGSSSQTEVSDKVLRGAVAILQVYGPQIDRAFKIANGVGDSILGLTPSESLSSCMLEEIEGISMIMFGLAKRQDRVMSYAASLFVAYKDVALVLLQRYLYFFTHPTHMQAQLYPINNLERQLAEEFVTPSKSASSSPPSLLFASSISEGKTSRLMEVTMKKTIRIHRNILAALNLLTNVRKVMSAPDIEWPFGNTILLPNLRVVVGEAASIGTIIESTNAALGFIKEYHESKDEGLLRGLLNVVEGSLVLLTTQTCMWIAKPGISEDVRREIADDNLTDVMNILAKVYSTLSKLDLPLPLRDQKTRAQLQVARLYKFLMQRYFVQ